MQCCALLLLLLLLPIWQAVCPVQAAALQAAVRSQVARRVQGQLPGPAQHSTDNPGIPHPWRVCSPSQAARPRSAGPATAAAAGLAGSAL